jgi:threonine/homoserine/homoserine lactone efflux protein
VPSPDTLVAFAVATLVLLIVPGPAVMYIVTRSATQGRSAGLMSVAGIHVGTVVHVGAAMVGLSAVLAASATAFAVVKLAGAAYLVWLGVQSLRSWRAGRVDAPSSVEARSHRRIFVDGVVLNVLNPKTAVFFLSFVPQFVDPTAPSATLSIGLLGAIFIGLGLVTDGAYACAGGWLGSRLSTTGSFRRRQQLVAGGTYVCLGAATALAGNHSS